jgi:hypothetical protein
VPAHTALPPSRPLLLRGPRPPREYRQLRART